MFMFKKLNPLILIGLLVVLLIAVVLILQMDARKQKGSFLDELINADSQKTTSIVVVPKGIAEDAITLEKNEDRWVVGSHGKMYQANREHIARIFESLSPMIPEQLVSRSKESWPEYEIEDVSGTRVKIYEGKSLSGDFTYGKLSFQQQMMQGQQRPKISTFVRLQGQDDVYSVDGFLGSAFPAITKQYRDQTVISVNKDDISKISMQGAGEYNYTISREGNNWLLNGNQVDSVMVEHVLNSISSANSSGFVEQESEGLLTVPSHQLTVERIDAMPVEIKAYPADSTHQYFITSSQNPGAVFSGSQNELFESIFYRVTYFSGKDASDDSL
jgi:hypothetical protein